jgi:hypothetical protein
LFSDDCPVIWRFDSLSCDGWGPTIKRKGPFRAIWRMQHSGEHRNEVTRSVEHYASKVPEVTLGFWNLNFVRIFYRDFRKSECAAPGASDRLRKIILGGP